MDSVILKFKFSLFNFGFLLSCISVNPAIIPIVMVNVVWGSNEEYWYIDKFNSFVDILQIALE